MQRKSVERDETHSHENNELDMDSIKNTRMYAVESDPGGFTQIKAHLYSKKMVPPSSPLIGTSATLSLHSTRNLGTIFNSAFSFGFYNLLKMNDF